MRVTLTFEYTDIDHIAGAPCEFYDDVHALLCDLTGLKHDTPTLTMTLEDNSDNRIKCASSEEVDAAFDALDKVNRSKRQKIGENE